MVISVLKFIFFKVMHFNLSELKIFLYAVQIIEKKIVHGVAWMYCKYHMIEEIRYKVVRVYHSTETASKSFQQIWQ